jgi:hypothetical protein
MTYRSSHSHFKEHTAAKADLIIRAVITFNFMWNLAACFLECFFKSQTSVLAQFWLKKKTHRANISISLMLYFNSKVLPRKNFSIFRSVQCFSSSKTFSVKPTLFPFFTTRKFFLYYIKIKWLIVSKHLGMSKLLPVTPRPPSSSELSLDTMASQVSLTTDCLSSSLRLF